MAVFSGGASLVAKLLSRLGKVGKVIAEILAKILPKSDRQGPRRHPRPQAVSRRRVGKHGHSKDSKEKAVAVRDGRWRP